MKLEWIFLVFCILCTFMSTPIEAGSCPSYCLHNSVCETVIFSNPKCTCTDAFRGRRCQNNGMTALRNEVEARDSYTLDEAKTYAERALFIIVEHQKYDYQLGTSIKEMNTILQLISYMMDSTSDRGNSGENDDLFPLTEDFVTTLSHIVTILNTKGCEVNQVVNCTLSETEYASILEKAEENIYKITNVLLKHKSEDKTQQTVTIDRMGLVSLTVLKAKGKDLPFTFPATYGSVILPYFETFQDTIGGEEICVNVLTYIRSPYGYVNNTNAVDSGIIKVVITDKDGDKINLNDLDDPVDMTVDMSQVFSVTSTWKEMEKLSDGRSLVVAFLNKTYEAYVVEFDIQSLLKCDIYGRFGYTGYPTHIKHDIRIKTKGFNQILAQKPDDLPITFENQKMQITVYNTKMALGGVLDPLVLTLTCEDDLAKRKKRQAATVHQARIQEIAVYSLNGDAWEKPPYAQLNKAEGNFVKFKSTFFGTFASNGLFLPPSTIDFDSLFANFLDRLFTTPHVLVTFVVLFVLLIVLTVVLRRKDKRDFVMWEFLHLIDNKTGEEYRYCISVLTAIRSSRHLTSTPYFRLDGKLASTGDRILRDGKRHNFGSGTCSNFIMTTKEYLGNLKKFTIWIDNKGNSPDWMVSKVVIVDLKTDQKYVFLSSEWLSERFGKCETWAVMEPLSDDLLNSETIFTDASRKGFFDDHLWFSISTRPNYSRFTRVQRLWCLVALLFLSMISSAMWFNQEPSEDTMTDEEIEAHSIQSIKLGPFTLNYKQIYVGFMSSVITFLPSLAIVAIFKNRREKGERYHEYFEQNNMDGTSKRKRPRMLPWWSIFFAYTLIFLCILVPGTFTFLYSLEFGPDKTNDWMLSFIFGTALGVLILEPLKVLLLAVIVCCCLSKTTERLSDLGDNYRLKNEDESMINTSVIYFPCPRVNDHKIENKTKKKLFQLDNELAQHVKSWILCAAYVILLAVICSHNITTEAFRQNDALKLSINDDFQPNTTDDIWTWINEYYIPTIWPKWYSNQQLRTAYEQRFTSFGYDYRMSLIQIRQVRSGGNCTAPDTVLDTVARCTNGYDMATESTMSYCPGWETLNASCFDQNELTDYSFLYNTPGDTKGHTYFGKYAVYGGGGYLMQLGPKQSLVIKFIDRLRSESWIDGDTRAIFIDSNTFNANSRLFSHLKVVFEISQYGAVSMTTSCTSSNLYPYVYALDYIIMFLQFLFVTIVVIKMIRFGIGILKLKRKCCTTFGMWITLAEIILSLMSIIFFIMRIDKTIKAVKEINSGGGEFVSFEDVETFDYVYRLSLAGVFFLAILRLLEPLSFNYHLYVLQNALNRCKGELFSYILILTIAILAFASYLFLTVGKIVKDFKDMFTAMKTLLQMLLSMISFRFNVQMSSMQAQIVVSVFAFTISMIGINFFIGILTWNFYYMKVFGDYDEGLETQMRNDGNTMKENKNKTKESVNRELTYEHSGDGNNKSENVMYSMHDFGITSKGEKCKENKMKMKFTNKGDDTINDEHKETENLKPKRFNYELNAHFWRRLDEIIQRVIPSFKRKPDHLSKRLERVYNRYDAIARDEVQWFIIACAMMMAGRRKAFKFLLSCNKSADSGGVLYRFYELNSQRTHLLLYMPFVRLQDAPEIDCYVVSINHSSLNRLKVPFMELAKSSLYEFVPRSNLMSLKFGAKLTYKCCNVHPEDMMACTFDNSKTWNYMIPREYDALRLFSCYVATVPSRAFLMRRQENIRIDIWDLDQYPDIERHRLLITGRFIRLKADPRITFTIPANSSEEHGDIITLIERPIGLLCPILHIYSTRYIAGPLDICLPIFQDQSNGSHGDLWVMFRENNGLWEKIKCHLDPCYNQMKVRLSGIKMKTPTAICIKNVTLPWKPDPKSGQELKFAMEINELSERHAIQMNWRDLARKCDVSITSKFDYQKNGSISVENKVYAFTMNKCTFKRITTPPMSDQEKCMVILSLWIKGLQTTHQVTSLIPLLKRKNIEYLTARVQETKKQTGPKPWK